MATYCISDIHGNLKALCALLVEVDFHYDGSDTLYMLGDYVDWGPDSIETLFFCMRLSNYPFVTCLMGNHDLMFYQQIINSERGTNNKCDLNWLYNNRGFSTWEQYLMLPDEQKEMVENWLASLPYASEVFINNKWYLLGHAGPFLPEEGNTPADDDLKKFRAVWYRIKGPNSNPLLELKNYPNTTWEKHEYKKFICGHSVTYHYKKFEENEPYSVFFGKNFIDIDCGAKCLGLDLRKDVIEDDKMIQCRLAILKLDDMSVTYCDRARAGYTVPGAEEDEGYDDRVKE